MDEHIFRQTVANNLIYYRKAAGLTQHELASMLCYTDKSVSKWERAEGLPDLITLARIAEIYNVTVNDLISEKHKKAKSVFRINKLVVSALSSGLVWLIAILVYVVLSLVLKDKSGVWLAFIYAIPVNMILLIVFSSIWSKKWVTVLFVSLLIWSTLLALYLSLANPDVWLLFLIGIPLQIMSVLWLVVRIPPKLYYFLDRRKQNKKKKLPHDQSKSSECITDVLQKNTLAENVESAPSENTDCN